MGLRPIRKNASTDTENLCPKLDALLKIWAIFSIISSLNMILRGMFYRDFTVGEN